MGNAVPIVVDSREQKPYRFPGHDSIIRRTIHTGDYTHDGYEDVYAVERKTLDDLATSLGDGRERFEREMRRAQSLEEFVVVIEAPADDVYDYKGEGQGSNPNYYSDIAPNSITGTVEKWPQKYDTLRFEWCGDRVGAMQETLSYLDKWYLKYAGSIS